MARYRAHLTDESIIDFRDDDKIDDLMLSFAEHEYLIVTAIFSPALAPSNAQLPSKFVLFWAQTLLIEAL